MVAYLGDTFFLYKNGAPLLAFAERDVIMITPHRDVA